MSQKAVDNHKLFESFQSKREEWAIQAANNEDFFLGKQWTDAEIEALKKKGMAPLVVNRTMPIILQEVAIFTAKDPQFRAIPREDGDVKVASMWSDVLAYIWHISDGTTQRGTFALDYFNKGVGYFEAYVDPYADDGRGEVMFRHIPVWDVYPDPNSREIDMSDAGNILVSRLVPENQLRFMYPDKWPQIRKATNENGTMSDRPSSNPIINGGITQSDYSHDDGGAKGTIRKIRTIDNYEKIRVPFIKIFHKGLGVIEVIEEKNFNADTLPSQSDYVKIWRTKVRLTRTCGENVFLGEKILNTAHYPIIPGALHHTGTPYPDGDVTVLKGMQQEANKRRSIMIHNATLASNFRLVTQKGSLADKADWEARGSKPGYNLEYHQGYDKPDVIWPQQLPSAWVELEQEAKGDMEYAVSVFAHMMGSSSDAPDTYRGLLALEEAGQRKVRHKMRHANGAIRKLGLVLMDLARDTYQIPKIMRIVGEGEELKELMVNEPVVDPQTGTMVSRLNDITVGQYDLVVTDGTAMPTNRMALLNLYLEMYQLGIVDKAEVLKKTDIVDREGVLNRMGEVEQANARLQQMEETVKDVEGLNQTLRRQLQQSEVQLGIAQGGESVKASFRQTAAEQKLARARIADTVKTAAKEMALERKKWSTEAKSAAAQEKSERMLRAAQAEANRRVNNGRE
jgi:hypothetical protein